MSPTESTRIDELIQAAWRIRYKEDVDPVTVTEKVEKAFGGILAAVLSVEKEGNKPPVESTVFVYPDDKVLLFSTTDELVRFFQERSRHRFVRTLSDASFIAGFVFLVLIGLVFFIGFYKNTYSSEAFATLSSVLGAAAGFFFGTKKD